MKFSLWRKRAEEQPYSTQTEKLSLLCDEVADLLDQDYSAQAVHLADQIYGFAGDRGLELRVQLHLKYSVIASSNEEIFWSRWQLVDTLALLRHCEDAAEEQLSLYGWSRKNLTSDYVLQALSDSTQAHCWVATGRFNDWSNLYLDTLPLIMDGSTHHSTKCFFLRTGAEMFAEQGRLDNAYEQVVQLEKVNNEEPEGKDYLTFWYGVITSKLEIFRREGRWDEYENIMQQTLLFFDYQIQALPENPSKRDQISAMAHDVGACLLWTKRYTQARPLLEFAALHQGAGITHLFLSACIWGEEKDRVSTLHHLRLAQHTTKGNYNLRGRYRTLFLETEEFYDVQEDLEFLEVVS